VTTKFQENDTATPLPQNSIYTLVKDKIDFTVSGRVNDGSRVDANVYADKVVNNVLKTRPTLRQWVGGSVTTMWAIHTFLWDTVWV
jgi:hypothetical protein